MTTADDSVSAHQSCETSPKARCVEFISILFRFNTKPKLIDKASLTLQYHQNWALVSPLFSFSLLYCPYGKQFFLIKCSSPLCSCAVLLQHVWWAQINYLYLFFSDWALTSLRGSLQSPEGESVFQCPGQAQPRKQKERRGEKR